VCVCVCVCVTIITSSSIVILLVFSQRPSIIQVRLCILCNYSKYVYISSRSDGLYLHTTNHRPFILFYLLLWVTILVRCCQQPFYVALNGGITHVGWTEEDLEGTCVSPLSSLVTYTRESVKRSQMDIKRKTCNVLTWKKHLFLDMSSTNIVTLVP
jgi:hypothetical protein